MSEQTKAAADHTVETYGVGGVMSMLIALITFVASSPELRQLLIDLLKKLGILNAEGQAVDVEGQVVSAPAPDVAPVDGE